MKKSVMYSETRTWFFDLDMAEGADLDEVMSVLKGTDGFYRYVDDGTSEEIECEWSEVPEDWRGKGDPDYTEEFREIAERELDTIHFPLGLKTRRHDAAYRRACCGTAKAQAISTRNGQTENQMSRVLRKENISLS